MLKTRIEQFKKLAILISMLPLVILLRIIRPIIWIRFVDLNAGRIGHFITNTEVYLSKREASLCDSRIKDIYYYIPPVCNHQLLVMWARVIPVTASRFIYWLAWANRKVPGWQIDELAEVHGERDIDGVVDMTKQRLFFTEEEENRGQEGLRLMGIPPDKPFVCFHARDNAYLAKIYPETDWSYHDYRDADIENYRLAIQKLSDNGYYTVRMGAVVKERFPSASLRIIDYACGPMRSDFFDLYLLAKCYFFINCECGISNIARLFRRPMVSVNQIPMDHVVTWDPNFLVIFKKLWLRSDKRFLTFHEILKSEIGRFPYSGQYEKYGIEVIQNSPEEIWDAVEEMEQRLRGYWTASEEYEELQRRFWSLYEKNDLHGVIRARIGSKFLLQNRDLLNSKGRGQ